jgi:serine/threonine-protein kinase
LIDPNLTGRQFGAYEVLEELGSGGMGKVYRARNTTLDRLVALKTLSGFLSSDQAFVQRFLKEARVAARLNHPNIVQIYDFGHIEETHYIAMEYVDGQSLRKQLAMGRFNEHDALIVARQAVRGLAVAHAQGIVHRDIKPDNLMLTMKGEVKIVDLGIAKRLDEDQNQTQTGQAIGTPHYISPEQIKGQKDIDGRADIYSLGATLYHLVTGRAPYKGTSGALVMSMHLTAPMPDPREHEPTLSEGICRVLRKMMAKERDERYKDMIALDQDLYRVQTGETPEIDEPSSTAIATTSTPTGGAPRTAPWMPPLGSTPAPAPPASRRFGGTGYMEPVQGSRSIPPGVATPPHNSQPAVSVSAPAATPPAVTPSATPSSGPLATTGSVFREEDLHFVEVELAKHIGPLSRLLVKKAAKKAQNLVGLAAALADNIPNEAGRLAFRQVVRERAK